MNEKCTIGIAILIERFHFIRIICMEENKLENS